MSLLYESLFQYTLDITEADDILYSAFGSNISLHVFSA